MSDMPAFTPLELAALAAILKETVEDRIAVDQQLRQASVLSRENTGGGFFTTIAVGPSAENVNRNASLGQNVWMSIGGLDYGLGMILHFKGGRASLLEGYAVGAEDTSATDFERVRFAIANEPGRLATNGS